MSQLFHFSSLRPRRLPWTLALLLSSLSGGLLAPAVVVAATVLPPLMPELREGEKPAMEMMDAQRALERKDYARALGIFAEKAKSGDASAFFGLGYLYQQGLGVNQSVIAAETFYRRAAKPGHVPAMYNLASLLVARASGVAEGKEWLRRAAESGSGRAALALGRLLMDGPDAKAHASDAEAWFRKAAKAPELIREASFTLAVFLDPTLEGTDERSKEGRRFLEIAADAGHQPAVLALSDTLLRSKNGGASAVELLEKNAAAGFAEATFRLAALHLEGRVIPADSAKALQFFQKAAEAGHAMACNQLAVMYEQGKGVKASKEQAYQWFRKGGELGLPMAQFNTGVCLEEGRGIAKNASEACSWYSRAALAGYPPAQNRLALRYQDGLGVLRDPVAARAWLREGAQQGFEASILNYATMLADGQGGPRDIPTAITLYQSLATKNHPGALHGLGLLLESGLGSAPDPARALALQKLAADRNPAARTRAAALEEMVSDSDKTKAAAYVKDPQTLFR